MTSSSLLMMSCSCMGAQHSHGIQVFPVFEWCGLPSTSAWGYRNSKPLTTRWSFSQMDTTLTLPCHHCATSSSQCHQFWHVTTVLKMPCQHHVTYCHITNILHQCHVTYCHITRFHVNIMSHHQYSTSTPCHILPHHQYSTLIPCYVFPHH